MRAGAAKAAAIAAEHTHAGHGHAGHSHATLSSGADKRRLLVALAVDPRSPRCSLCAEWWSRWRASRRQGSGLAEGPPLGFQPGLRFGRNGSVELSGDIPAESAT